MKSVKKVQSLGRKIKSLQEKVKKVSDVVEHPLRSAGGQIGKRLGSKKRGEQIGSLLGKITGTGDYNISGSRLTSNSIPTFLPNKRGVRVVHREYLGDIRASSTAGAFQVTSYSLNPGLFQTFPWLSSFAQQFDQWRPNGLVAFVKTLSSNYSGTTSLGTVILATDYDVEDPPYASKIEMENSEFAVSANASESLVHAIECKPNERSNIYYTRSTSIPANDNLRFFDHGNLQVATSGCVADQLVGELWIAFDITLFKPQLYSSLGNNILFAELNGTAATDASPFNTATMSLVSSSLPVYPYNSSTSRTSISLTNNSITFPASLHGRSFFITYTAYGTTAANTEKYEHVLSNCSYGRNTFYNDPEFWSATGTAASIVQGTSVFLNGDPSLSATISYITGYVPDGTVTYRINIYQIPNPNI